MANSTTNLPLLLESQSLKATSQNAINDALSSAGAWGRNYQTCAALTWGYLGGVLNGVYYPNGTVALTASATNYVRVLTATGVVSVVTSAPAGWPVTPVAGYMNLYDVTTNTTQATSWNDWREGLGRPGPAGTNWAVTVNAQTGTTYTLVAGDNGVWVTLNNASAITLTVPSGLGANFVCKISQLGAGQVTITGSGATVNSYLNLMKLAGQYASGTLGAYAANAFELAGNLSA